MINPKRIPIIISDILSCMHKLFKVLPRSSLIIYKEIPVKIKITIYSNVFLVFPFSFFPSFLIFFSICLSSFFKIPCWFLIALLI